MPRPGPIYAESKPNSPQQYPCLMVETPERQVIADLAEERDWNRRVSPDRADVYMKGTVRIRLVWAGDAHISGATLFHDEMYESYTRDPHTIRAWLKR